MEEFFNQSLIDIEQALNKTFKSEYKPIAVSEDEWEPIKLEFNKNMKSKNNIYEYIEEAKTLDEVYQIKKDKIPEKNNEIEEIFEDMIVYS